jgi:hypothetical protein
VLAGVGFCICPACAAAAPVSDNPSAGDDRPSDLPQDESSSSTPLGQTDPAEPLDDDTPETTCDEGLLPAARLDATAMGDSLRIEVLAAEGDASFIDSVQLFVVTDDGSQNRQFSELGAFDVADVSTKTIDAATLIDVPLAELTSDFAGVTEFTGAISVLGQGYVGGVSTQWIVAEPVYWQRSEAKGAPTFVDEVTFEAHKGDFSGAADAVTDGEDLEHTTRIQGQPTASSADEGLKYLGALQTDERHGGIETKLIDVRDAVTPRAGFPICVRWNWWAVDSSQAFSPSIASRIAPYEAEDWAAYAAPPAGQSWAARFARLSYSQSGGSGYQPLWLDSSGCTTLPLGNGNDDFFLKIETQVRNGNGNQWRVIDRAVFPTLPIAAEPCCTKNLVTLASNLSQTSTTTITFDGMTVDPLYWSAVASTSIALYREPLGLTGAEVNLRVKQTGAMPPEALGSSNCSGAFFPSKRAYLNLGRENQADAKFLVAHELGHCLAFLRSGDEGDGNGSVWDGNLSTIRNFTKLDSNGSAFDDCTETKPYPLLLDYHIYCDERRGPKFDFFFDENLFPGQQTTACFDTNPPFSYEDSLVPLNEGLANLYALRVFNDREVEATMTWTSANFGAPDLVRDLFVYGYAAYRARLGLNVTGGWLGSQCCGHGDAAADCRVGAGTVADWTAALWNLYTMHLEQAPHCPAPTFTSIYDAGGHVMHESVNGAGTSQQAWALFADGVAPMDNCVESNWLISTANPPRPSTGARYGIDN